MRIYFLTCVLFGLFVTSCKKFTEVDFPVNQVGSDDVFDKDATAISAIAGIYAEIMSVPNQPANCALTFYAGMSADDLRYYSPDTREEFVKNELSLESHALLQGQLWGPAYKLIYVTNVSLEKLETSTSLTTGVKQRLRGECLYLRALHYFILVNLFGDVPLCISSDYRANSVLARTPAAKVYDQIISDLQEASSLLPANYVVNERGAPNKWAAKALLAKCFLYREQWDSARVLSSEVLQSGMYHIVPNVNDVYLKGSGETLWQLASVIATRNTWEGFYFLPNSNSSLPTYVATNELIGHFEVGDLRKTSWLKERNYAGSQLYYPFKYKVKQNASITEYQVVMRLAEVLLIRAEAQLRTGAVPEAADDINVVRRRAGLGEVSRTISSDSCMRLLVKERRSELFAEWGNRWFDLKRWNMASVVLGPIKGISWQPTDVLYPIPQTQIELNGNLVQNAGY